MLKEGIAMAVNKGMVLRNLLQMFFCVKMSIIGDMVVICGYKVSY